MGYYIELQQPNRYSVLSECMYCRTSGSETLLTDEHIIPLALSGSAVLPKSVCEDCQRKINEEFEQDVLRRIYILPRTKLQLRTRSPNGRPSTYPVWEHDKPLGGGLPRKLFREGDVRIETSMGELPTLIPSLVLPPPGLLAGRETKEDGQITVRALSFYSTGESPRAEQEHRDISILIPFDPGQLVKLMAKIAHGAAVAELGISAFSHFLPDLILGRSKNFSSLVGSPDMPLFSNTL
ncbi:MAG: hypothetical protein KDA56_13670, partial [Hyphomonas sp.]|nr:hypothetical protein [Hyphomonas sp.]